MNFMKLKVEMSKNVYVMNYKENSKLKLENETLLDQKLEFSDIVEPETRECTNPDMSSIESNKTDKQIRYLQNPRDTERKF